MDIKRSIWVEEEELGHKKVIDHKGKSISFEVPQKIDGLVLLRLKGIEKPRFRKPHDLLLEIRVNRGSDTRKDLWISETCARAGGEKCLRSGDETVRVRVPAGCRNGSVLRLKGIGNMPYLHGGNLPPHIKRGDLYVNLRMFPDRVFAAYGSFDRLDVDEMASEGQILINLDKLKLKGLYPVSKQTLSAGSIADLYNERDWKAIYDALVAYLGLGGVRIYVYPADDIQLPGYCQFFITGKGAAKPDSYQIKINSIFLDDPFCVAAILSHELCHVMHWETFSSDISLPVAGREVKMSVDDERMVDLLVFVHGLGEFQLRVARDRCMTLGYFRQANFERMQAILARKQPGQSR
jgi:hypothetical protein